MKKLILAISVSILYAALLSAAIEPKVKETKRESDDSTAEKFILIDKQLWMTKNLSVDNFRNGDPIPQAKTSEEWEKAYKNQQPAWCYFNNDTINGKKYGKMYNWFAVNDPRGLAPYGWHVPSNEEWLVLAGFLGGQVIAGQKMKADQGWGNLGKGTTNCGFSGLSGGFRWRNASFVSKEKASGWWSSTPESRTNNISDTLAWGYTLIDNSNKLGRGLFLKSCGLYVRCLNDDLLEEDMPMLAPE